MRIHPIGLVVLFGLGACDDAPRAETYVCQGPEDCSPGYRCAPSPIGGQPERRVCLPERAAPDDVDAEETDAPADTKVEETDAPADTDVEEVDAPPDTMEDARDGDADAAVRVGCGDGVQGSDEGCDDGNLRSHDGCSSGCTVEQPGWSRIETPKEPGPLEWHCAAYDRRRQRTVVFGGLDQNKIFQDQTWEYDGQTWVESSPDVSPEGRYGCSMVYHESAGVVVLYGGGGGAFGASYGLNDTWIYDGARWTPLGTETSPNAQNATTMTWDPHLERVLLFGGHNHATRAPFEELWELDLEARAWVERTPVETTPQARTGAAWVYDAARGRHVLFGGGEHHLEGGPRYDDTWVYDSEANIWTRLIASGPPDARRTPMVYHEARGRAVLFSGMSTNWQEYTTGTWELSDVGWSLSEVTSPAPSLRRFHVLAYDSHRARVVLYAGRYIDVLSDTWEYGYDSAWPDERCDDALDDDEDGLVSCDDPDCAEAIECRGGAGP